MILTVRLPLDVYHSSYFEGPRPVTFPNLNLLLNILVVCVCLCLPGPLFRYCLRGTDF